MANIRNLDAEQGANFIGDDAQPTLTITNTSTGPGLEVDDIVATSGATIVQADITRLFASSGATVRSAASTAVPLSVSRTVGSGPTSAQVAILASGASVPVIEFLGGAYVSAVSLIFAAGAGWAGMGAIRVKRSDGTLGWIPVLPNAQVTAAAVE